MSATCSDRGRRAAILAATVAALIAVPASAAAQSRPSPAEALALAFPTADSVERVTLYLTDSAVARVTRRARSAVPAVVTVYVAWSQGRSVGAGYFDAARVRTEREVLLIVVGQDGRIRRVEVVAFGEPPEYAPPERWLTQFVGLDSTAASSGDPVVPITGATLTTRAVEGAARRVLALHAELRPLAGKAGSP
jgi:hypothetical protein